MHLALMVEKFIKDYDLIEEGDNIFIGLSGGMDSMALCSILLMVKRGLNFNLYAMHMDHQLRNESADDLSFVEAFCDRNNILLFAERADVKIYAKLNRMSIELAARTLRHRFFNTIINDYTNAKIALAHHMNDKAETMLMRLLRGTSIDGLNPMPEKDGNIIRPLMCATRSEIEDYSSEEDIKWRIDASNNDVIYTRNFIRHNLITLIEKDINPSVVKTLNTEAKSFSEDKKYLHNQALMLSMKAKKTDDGYMLFDEDLYTAHPSIRKRVIKIILAKLGKNTDLYSKNIELVDTLFSDGDRRTGAVIELPDEYEARTHIMGVELVRKDLSKKIIEIAALNIEGITILNTGDIIKCEIVKVPDKSKLVHSPNIQYIDYMSLGESISVRSRATGDYIHPLGAKGKKKLKDYFIDKHINRWERDFIPLIMNENDVVWAIGYAMGNKYRITEDTAICLKIIYRKFGGE